MKKMLGILFLSLYAVNANANLIYPQTPGEHIARSLSDINRQLEIQRYRELNRQSQIDQQQFERDMQTYRSY